MTNTNRRVSVGNIKAFHGELIDEVVDMSSRIGEFMNAGSGWNSYAFAKPFTKAPFVSCKADGYEVDVKNVTETGFLYRVRVVGGDDSTGATDDIVRVQWLAVVDYFDPHSLLDYSTYEELANDADQMAVVVGYSELTEEFVAIDEAMEAFSNSAIASDAIANNDAALNAVLVDENAASIFLSSLTAGDSVSSREKAMDYIYGSETGIGIFQSDEAVQHVVLTNLAALDRNTYATLSSIFAASASMASMAAS